MTKYSSRLLVAAICGLGITNIGYAGNSDSYFRLGYSAYSSLDPDGTIDSTGSGLELGLRLSKNIFDLTVNHSDIVFDFEDDTANIDFNRTLGELGVTLGRDAPVSGRLGLGYENLDLETQGEAEGFIPRITVGFQALEWLGFNATIGYTDAWDFTDTQGNSRDAEALDYQFETQWRSTQHIAIYGRYQRTEVEISNTNTEVNIDHFNIGVHILF